MDAAQALAELGELSSQVERAVVLDAAGAPLASLPAAAAADDGLTRAALEAVAVAADLHAGGGEVTAVEVELETGGLFVLREGGRTIAATTGPDPTAGLVVYDLRTCLRRIEAEKPKRRRSPKKPPEEAGE
jgi:hypothetical protein